jgi:hypothetical protein
MKTIRILLPFFALLSLCYIPMDANAQTPEQLKRSILDKKEQQEKQKRIDEQSRKEDQKRANTQPHISQNNVSIPSGGYWYNNFFGPAEEGTSFLIWGMPSYTFGFSWKKSLDINYLSAGLGAATNLIPAGNDPDIDFNGALLWLVSCDFRYFSLGSLVGLGGMQRDEKKEIIHGETVISQEKRFGAYFLLSPFVEISIPLSDVSLQLAVGYNFHLGNWSEHNGLRIGIGVRF